MSTLAVQRSVIPSRDYTDNSKSVLVHKSDTPNLQLESERLKTFQNWKNKHLEPIELVKAGFYFTGINDVVTCAFCPVKGYNWQKGDDPMGDHTRWNRNCPFVRGQSTEGDNSANVGQDVCGNLGIDVFPNSQPEDPHTVTLERLGVQKTQGPIYPDYIIKEQRLTSYAHWPKSLKQRPEELSEAGFYYLGSGDQTMCFYCGGGLKDWEENDDPWEEHARWFSKCNYLVMKKGQKYVDAVRSKDQVEEVVPVSVGAEEEVSVPSSGGTKESLATEDVVSGKDDDRSDEKIGDENLCKICFKNKMSVLFYPCGHVVACVDCALALKQCAVCREPIQATVRAYLS